MSLEQAYEKHNNHDIKIIWKDIKDQPYWRKPALVCIDCNKQIQWLTTDMAVDLVNEFKIPEEMQAIDNQCRIRAYNRNRSVEDQVSTVEEIEEEVRKWVNEIPNS